MSNLTIYFEWFVSLLGVSGALLISIRKPVLGYCVCASSCVGIGFILYYQGNLGLLFQQAAFFVINMIGIYSWGKKRTPQPVEPARGAVSSKQLLFDS